MEQERLFSSTVSDEPSILLVDDDPAVELIWRLIIEKLDPRINFDWVTSEASAAEAIAQAESCGRKYELIICDIFLSGCGTGIDLWQKHKDRGMNFLFISGVSKDKFNEYFSRENEPQIFVKKPLNPTLCLRLLRKLLGLGPIY